MNNNIMGYDPNTGKPVYQNNTLEPQPKLNKSKKSFLIILICLGFFVIFFIAIFYIAYKNSDQLVCTSSQGNITLIYNEYTIMGYKATNFTYDLDEQQDIAEEIGVGEYLEEFKAWFQDAMDGTCVIKTKN